MKNTMKIKSLLSFFVPAAMMSLAVAGCSDYDNGYDSNAIKFNEEFRKAYGDIDPEQDWNLAERLRRSERHSDAWLRHAGRHHQHHRE